MILVNSIELFNHIWRDLLFNIIAILKHYFYSVIIYAIEGQFSTATDEEGGG